MGMGIQYTESLHEVLDWFNDEPCTCATIGQISDNTGYSRETVRKNMRELTAADCAELRHGPTALYRLIRDPRDDDHQDNE